MKSSDHDPNWGGARIGAGRPKVSEDTKVLRVPLSKLEAVQAFIKGESGLFGDSEQRAELEAQILGLKAQLFAFRFRAAFEQLDRAAGARNFVSLVDLRSALGDYSRAEFDEGLYALRVGRIFDLSASEGRHGITPEMREAGIRETQDGPLLLYVSEIRKPAAVESAAAVPSIDGEPADRAALLALASRRHDQGETFEAIAIDFNRRGWTPARYPGARLGKSAPAQEWTLKTLYQATQRAKEGAASS